MIELEFTFGTLESFKKGIEALEELDLDYTVDKTTIKPPDGNFMKPIIYNWTVTVKRS